MKFIMFIPLLFVLLFIALVYSNLYEEILVQFVGLF